jgi:glycosyltransferase involved in cell wall biosynthesis
MMKIGIFTGYFPPHLGGVERYVDKLSLALQNIGYEIVIVTTNDGTQKDHEILNGRHVYRLPIKSLFKGRYPIPEKNKNYKQLVSNIEAEGIDYFIVNTRFHLTSLIGARIAKQAHRPCLLIEHGTGHFSVGNKFLDFFGAIYEHILSKILSRYITSYYGVSQNCNKWLMHFGIKGQGVFYNAIDKMDAEVVNDTYDEIYSQDITVVTYAGRLIKEKGILNLIEAYLRIVNTNPQVNLRLAIAGGGELMQRVRNTYGNNGQIDLLGKLDFTQVMSLYARTDIFVHPSLYPEGLPTSILEAGLMGCAIIATPRGGTEEVIVNNDHGIIVEGSVDSLYDALLVYIQNKELRRQSAVRVKKRIETIFEWNSVARQVDEVIKELSEDKDNGR